MRENRPVSLRNMKARVIAGLKWEPEILALKISKMKNPLNSPATSPDWKQLVNRAVRKHVPRNSKSRMSNDSLKVVMQS
jgi:hypothetical protein